jgi:hypothetical protein
MMTSVPCLSSPGVAVRFGKPVPHVILGHENDDSQAEAELRVWCDIAKVLHSLRKGRIGLMGHVLESMYDMHTDPCAVTATFGCHVPLLEPHDLLRHYRAAVGKAIEAKKSLILDFFATPDPEWMLLMIAAGASFKETDVSGTRSSSMAVVKVRSTWARVRQASTKA